MRRCATGLLALALAACGGSEQGASPPPETPAAGAQAPTPAPRRPSFPAEQEFRLGETVTLRGGGAAECRKLYLRDRPVALVEMYVHTGRGAVLRRCEGAAWANAAEPTADELSAASTPLDGRLAEDFDGLGVNADGGLTFTPLGLSARVSELSFSGRWAAYATTSNTRDAAGGGTEADVVAVVYDLPSRGPLQQYILGACSLPRSDELSLPTPTWAPDGRAVIFRGNDRCSFEDVELHPE